MDHGEAEEEEQGQVLDAPLSPFCYFSACHIFIARLLAVCSSIPYFHPVGDSTGGRCLPPGSCVCAFVCLARRSVVQLSVAGWWWHRVFMSPSCACALMGRCSLGGCASRFMNFCVLFSSHPLRLPARAAALEKAVLVLLCMGVSPGRGAAVARWVGLVGLLTLADQFQSTAGQHTRASLT